MSRSTLERNQVWIYLLAIVAGLVVGTTVPAVGDPFHALLWPVLAALLYATFTQVPLLDLADAFSDHRFMAATLIGNFVVVPALVWCSLPLLPGDLPLRLGVLLVLLAPCTDWFITFCQLGKGSTSRAIAITPIQLVLQLLLLPIWVRLFLGDELNSVVPLASLLPAFGIVLVPLLGAAMTERCFAASPTGKRIREVLAWWPIPLLASVIFMIAATQVGEVRANASLIAVVVPFFIAYLVAAALLGRVIAKAAGLSTEAGRVVIFSLGSRNSFLIMPFALALPVGWEMTAIVIVVQSIVELFGMAFYLWWIPGHLLKSEPDASHIEPAPPV